MRSNSCLFFEYSTLAYSQNIVKTNAIMIVRVIVAWKFSNDEADKTLGKCTIEKEIQSLVTNIRQTVLTT
jgi:hypothetical protein